jgi:methylenetetrahydrofolate reductase (NADPH)
VAIHNHHVGRLQILVKAIRTVDTEIRLGVAAYPEGHPSISNEVLLEDLKRKQPLVQFMSTQLCFDALTIKNWLEQTRNNGITLPVQIGMAGVVDIIKLTQIATRIGVGDSLRYLTKHAGQVFKLMTGYKPDDLVQDLEPFYDDPFYNVIGFHVYTFNQVEKTERWRQETLAHLQVATPYN